MKRLFAEVAAERVAIAGVITSTTYEPVAGHIGTLLSPGEEAATDHWGVVP